MTPDFGPGDFGQDDPRDGDDLRAQARVLRWQAADDAREMRENGYDAAGERATEAEYEMRDYEMSVR